MENNNLSLNENMLDMENMEINIAEIENALAPELPDSVAAFMNSCVDKPY